MKPIAVMLASVNDSRCRSCGAPVVWAQLANSDRRMPFNPPLVFVPALNDMTIVGHVDTMRTVSHFATCPDAKRWRKAKQ